MHVVVSDNGGEDGDVSQTSHQVDNEEDHEEELLNLKTVVEAQEDKFCDRIGCIMWLHLLPYERACERNDVKGRLRKVSFSTPREMIFPLPWLRNLRPRNLLVSVFYTVEIFFSGDSLTVVETVFFDLQFGSTASITLKSCVILQLVAIFINRLLFPQ